MSLIGQRLPLSEVISSVLPYAGRLKSITDRNGNQIAFAWETSTEGVERIDYAIDTLGHQIDFIYHSESHDGQYSDIDTLVADSRMREQLIWKIQDHAGRVFEYNYSVLPDNRPFAMLASLTTPAIENTPDFVLPVEHERFSEGREWRYTYNVDPSVHYAWEGKMLESITSPNGDVVLSNTYNTLSEHDDPNLRRVLRQTYGGASYNYMLTDLGGDHIGFSGNTNLNPPEDYYVWVNDRRGAITRFKYAGENSTEGFYRELLERTDFGGFVSDPDRSTWAKIDEDGVLTWYYLRENQAQYAGGEWHAGPVVPSSVGQIVTYQQHDQPFEGNLNWKMVRYEYPNGDNVEIKYNEHDNDLYPSGPLVRGEVLRRTRNSATSGQDPIVEEWEYKSGVGTGCGCGAGSNNFYSAYKDGEGFITLRDYNEFGDLLAEYQGLPVGTSMSLIPPSATPAAVHKYTYNEWGQVLTHEHPSKMTVNELSAEVEFSRVDRFEYYSDASDENNYGRLYKEHIDDTGFDLITTYEYDAIGNVIKTVGPGDTPGDSGDVAIYTYNQASELVTEQHYDDGEQTLFAQIDYFYDANGNLVRQEVLNLDANQDLVLGNGSITTVFEYDMLDYITDRSDEAAVFNGSIDEYVGGAHKAKVPVASAGFVNQVWEYDLGKNLIKKTDGEIDNAVEYTYDARNLMVKSRLGAGTSSSLVIGFLYDEKMRNVTKTVNPDEPLNSQVTQIVYDGFDRIIKSTDPMGNYVGYTYDKNGNLKGAMYSWELLDDLPGEIFQGVTQTYFQRTYDSMNRMLSHEINVRGFGYDLGSILDPFYTSVTTFAYNDDDSIRTTVSPSGVTGSLMLTEMYYDTASRLEFVRDGAENVQQYVYDRDSNVTKMINEELSDLQLGDEFFEVAYTYDALDRMITSIDGVGNQSSVQYDSRSNILQSTDALGNSNLYTYDALSRLKTSSLGGLVTTSHTYDQSSRVISETDSNGNITGYEYDGLSRLTKTTMPDGAEFANRYNAHGNLDQHVDARGVIISNTYDLNNRIKTRVISGTAVPGTTTESYTYDGLGRLRTAENGFGKITRRYDSRSSLVREVQNVDSPSYGSAFDRVMDYAYDEANNQTRMTYPSGREIHRSYDVLNRLSGIFNDAAMLDPISQMSYVGNRLQRREHGNGTRTDYGYNGFNDAVSDPNDQGFGRVASISTTNVASASVIDGFDFTWDAAQNRTAYKDVGSGMKNQRERFFSYDSANRLVGTDVDFPNPLTDFTAPTNNGITTYALDGVHNRTSVAGFEAAGAPIGVYTETGDHAKNNQYTMTPRADGGEWIYAYDNNGNMILKYQLNIADFNGDYIIDFFDIGDFLAAHGAGDSEADINNDGIIDFFDVGDFLAAAGPADGSEQLENWQYTYDFRNQLIEAKGAFGINVFSKTTNAYDALGRRVIESLDPDDDGTADIARQLVYGGISQWEVIEQIQLASGGSPEILLSTHVYGLGIDDEVSYRIENDPTPKDIWAHRDDLNSLTSISDDAGVILERYEYGDYGQVVIMDASGLALPSSAFKAYHLYTGRSLIAGTGLYDYRIRVMDPETGRFIQRDPLGHIDSMNVYAYVVSSPFNLIDPYGLEGVSWWETLELIVTNEDVRDSFYDGAKDGGMSTIDGIIPFSDPFAERGMYDPCDPLLKISHLMGRVIQEAIVTAVGARVIKFVMRPTRTVLVTRYGTRVNGIQQAIRPGQAVMKGGRSTLGWVLSGKAQPGWVWGKNQIAGRMNYTTMRVLRTQVHSMGKHNTAHWFWDKGVMGLVKRVFGQRTYIP